MSIQGEARDEAVELPKQTGLQNPLVGVLYRRCLAQQQELGRQNKKADKAARTAALAFGPLLQRKPELESSPSPSDSPELRTSKDQWMADKYRQLLRHIKSSNHKGREQLYQILAMWLQEEGILSPQEFLPPDLFSQLSKATSDVFGAYKPSEKYYADLVEAWLPYFEQLMKVSRLLRLEKQIEKTLEQTGYDADAVQIVVHQRPRTRTAISAAIQFVALRMELDEYTFRTAHSRIYGRTRKNLPATTFPEKQSE
jgi:hypothetical protein